MKLYFFDPHTYEFVKSGEAQIDANGNPITDVLFATTVQPIEDIPEGYTIKFINNNWELIEDHRQHINSQGIKEGGTPFWLPEDDYKSLPRYLTELGPLPDGAILSCPEKSEEQLLLDLKSEKLSKFNEAMIELDTKLTRSSSDILMVATNLITIDEEELEQSKTIFIALKSAQAQNRIKLSQIIKSTSIEEIQNIEPIRFTDIVEVS